MLTLPVNANIGGGILQAIAPEVHMTVGHRGMRSCTVPRVAHLEAAHSLSASS